jgi:hypothetical protein
MGGGGRSSIVSGLAQSTIPGQAEDCSVWVASWLKLDVCCAASCCGPSSWGPLSSKNFSDDLYCDFRHQKHTICHSERPPSRYRLVESQFQPGMTLISTFPRSPLLFVFQVSTLLREGQNVVVREGSSMLDDIDRGRILKDVTVNVGDVYPMEDARLYEWTVFGEIAALGGTCP